MGQNYKRFRESRMPFPLRDNRKNPCSMYARVPQAMAQFVLKIEKLSHIMGPAPILGMARAHGLRPDYGSSLHLLVFTGRKIQGFPIVLLSVNLSIRSIIRYFPITVNLGKRLFSGIYRSVNTWQMSCLPVFTDVFPV